MSFLIIHGTFHVTGYAPDGDSVRFQAKKSALWGKLAGPKVRLNARNHAQLRFEGIDTLETHYEGEHQPLQYADKATVALLAALGIDDVRWNAKHTRVLAAEDGTPGFLLAREIEKNRRPVAFVFTGRAPGADGARVHLDGALLRRSVNYQQLRRGLAYPTFYSGLFHDLRTVLTGAVRAARAAGRGLWPQDRSTRGFNVHGLATVTDDVVILPKLFRRLAHHLADGGTVAKFKDYLVANPDPVMLLDTAHFTALHTIVSVQGKRVRLTVPPERIVFLPK